MRDKIRGNVRGKNRNGNEKLVELMIFHLWLRSLRELGRMVQVLLLLTEGLRCRIIPLDLIRLLKSVSKGERVGYTCDGPEIKVFQDYFFTGGE